MSKRVTATELRRNLAEYLNRVSTRGENFIVQRAGRPVAELRPHTGGVTGREVLERLRSGPHLTPEEAISFAKDIEMALAEAEPRAAPDRYE